VSGHPVLRVLVPSDSQWAAAGGAKVRCGIARKWWSIAWTSTKRSWRSSSQPCASGQGSI